MDCRRALPHVSGEIKRLLPLICRNIVNGQIVVQVAGVGRPGCPPAAGASKSGHSRYPVPEGRRAPALFVESCAMNDANALDKLDKAILRRLQDNGRETYDVIGEQVGLSPSAVLRRVKRLEDSGVIARYVALVKPEAVGLGLTAYLNVRLEKHTESHKRNPMDLFRASVQTWP